MEIYKIAKFSQILSSLLIYEVLIQSNKYISFTPIIHSSPSFFLWNFLTFYLAYIPSWYSNISSFMCWYHCINVLSHREHLIPMQLFHWTLWVLSVSSSSHLISFLNKPIKNLFFFTFNFVCYLLSLLFICFSGFGYPSFPK